MYMYCVCVKWSTVLRRRGIAHVQNYNTWAWCMMGIAGCLGTYDSEPEDDLACLLLFRARSLSPCVRPFRSSSSLYCKANKMQCIDKVVGVCAPKNNAAKSKPDSKTSYQNSPVPFLPSWVLCSCCSRWCLCRPLQTGSWSRPSCHSLAHLAFSPGKHLPLPTDCSASWCTKFQWRTK